MGIVVRYSVASFDALALALSPFVGDVTRNQLIGALRGAGMPDPQVTADLITMAHQHVVDRINGQRAAIGQAPISLTDYPDGTIINLDSTVTHPDGTIHSLSKPLTVPDVFVPADPDPPVLVKERERKDLPPVDNPAHPDHPDHDAWLAQQEGRGKQSKQGRDR